MKLYYKLLLSAYVCTIVPYLLNATNYTEENIKADIATLPCSATNPKLCKTKADMFAALEFTSKLFKIIQDQTPPNERQSSLHSSISWPQIMALAEKLPVIIKIESTQKGEQPISIKVQNIVKELTDSCEEFNTLLPSQKLIFLCGIFNFQSLNEIIPNYIEALKDPEFQQKNISFNDVLKTNLKENVVGFTQINNQAVTIWKNNNCSSAATTAFFEKLFKKIEEENKKGPKHTEANPPSTNPEVATPKETAQK